LKQKSETETTAIRISLPSNKRKEKSTQPHHVAGQEDPSIVE
jgi:hypothetical protein